MRIDVDGQNTPTASVICVYASTKFRKKRMKTIPYNSNILKVELEALKWGLDLAISVSNQADKVEVMSDREDLVHAFNGSGESMSMLRYDEEIQHYLKKIEGKNISIHWISRNQNRAGIALEKRLKTVKNCINKIVSGRKRWY